MMYRIKFDRQADIDFQKHVRAGNTLLVAKIKRLLEDIKQNPYEGIGKPHRMRYYQGENVWSRRIDSQHRITYRVDDGVVTVIVISLWGHYEDK